MAGGPAQARHAFLQGCGLPAAWARRPQWRILATGFGSGLDFLASWHAWRGDPQRPALLHYAAIDARPVPAGDLLRAAECEPPLQPLAEALAARWQGLTPGFHRFAFEDGHMLLTLCVGDTAAMLREQDFVADAVFLETQDPAFAPATGGPSLKALTRLCRRGTVLAAPAGTALLRHDLASAGWQVESGGGLAARYDPAWQVKGRAGPPEIVAADAVVVGAGLAGAAAAASLARRGWKVRVLDAAGAPAAGASALPAGLLAPHQSPDDNLLSRLSRAGVRIALQEARERLAEKIEWSPTPVLEWRGDDARPLPAIGDALAPWSREATQAQKRTAGIAAAQAAWWHENAAWIAPAALVRAWLRTPGVRFTGGCKAQRIVQAGERWRIEGTDGNTLAETGLVVVAGALASGELLAGRIEVHPVRGQVTWAPHGEDAPALPPFAVNGHGHFLPRVPLVERGAWITGSTYGRGDADASIRSADHAANLQRVREVLPAAAAVMEAAAARGETRSWSGVRCTASDRRPLLGAVAPGLWVSTAMGSRGLTFAALCGELLAARLHREPLPLEARLAQALAPARQTRESG